MVTNFAHMKEWNVMYQKLLFLEDVILDIKNKESCIQVISTARGVIDILLKELVKEAGITDAQIIQICGQEQGRVNLFDRIKVLEAKGYITPKTAENLHTIRKYGNQATHGEETFVGKSVEELTSIAEKIYEILYRETYLFANQYVKEARANRNTKSTATSGGNNVEKKTGSCGGTILTVIGIIIFIYVFVSCVGANL